MTGINCGGAALDIANTTNVSIEGITIIGHKRKFPLSFQGCESVDVRMVLFEETPDSIAAEPMVVIGKSGSDRNFEAKLDDNVIAPVLIKKKKK